MWLALLLLATLVVKALVLAKLHAHPLLQPAGELDTAVYVGLARRAAAGDWALGPDVYYVSPFYVYFLAVVFKVTGGSLLAAKAVQILLGTAAVGLVFATARRLFGERPAWIAAALAVGTGVFSFNEILVLQSAVDPFLTALALFLLARGLTSDRPRDFIVAGLAFGLFATNRPNALLCAVAAGAALLLSGRSRAGLARGAAFLLGTALALAPVVARNRMVAGEWALLTSHGGLNFYIGNNPDADGAYHSVAGIMPSIEGQARDARKLAETALGRPLTASEVSGYFYGRAFEWWRTRPRDALALLVRKLAYVLNDIDLSLNYSYAYYGRDEPSLLRALVVGPWLLVPLGFVGLIAARPSLDRARFWAWAVFVPAYAVSVAAFFVSSRYRMPLLVPLSVTSGAALGPMFAAIRAGEGRRFAALGLGAAALAVVALWPTGLDDGRAGERTEMILFFVDNGRFEEARALLARTEPTHPEPALLDFRVGRAFLDQGRLPEAKALFEKALGAEPRRSEVLLALGDLELQLGDAAGAAAHLQRAVEAAPQLAGAREKLGLALAMLGRRSEAAAQLEEACLLDPLSASGRLNLAVVLAELGRFPEARTRAAEALALEPDYPQARGLLEALRSK